MTEKSIKDLVQRFATTLGVDPDTPPAFLSRKQTSLVTGVPERTLANFATRGGGPPYTKVGRSVRYPAHDLAEYLLSRTYSHSGEATG